MKRLFAVLLIAAIGLVVVTPIGPVQFADIGVTSMVSDSVENAESRFGDSSEAGSSEINETKISLEVHERINEIRSDRRVDQLQYSQSTAANAEDHSEWMADRLRLEHANIEEQYQCDTVGENIGYTYASQDIAMEGGYVNYDGNETRIAHGIVRQWMDSPGNQDTVLREEFSSQGIGVATTQTDDGQRIYVTQTLCG
ncbi:CAP domain-containing protein [Halobellus clavatus]|uniref:Uncharacterized conserved protein YkwD, contains CAP (CSP/antigen 5/PR1) domain n=1 Tax=Halobellus clavatus TaxID=660517 RepID=A0A1H3GK78_9EURY|nr:CAP domain-containing protein [Halobellus clavatus]SDY03706.1 Uncharacterized conserved protein YkwD, contains CAP (CSP/antigen 5/PR1) domain [Halobellus clavatus]